MGVGGDREPMSLHTADWADRDRDSIDHAAQAVGMAIVATAAWIPWSSSHLGLSALRVRLADLHVARTACAVLLVVVLVDLALDLARRSPLAMRTAALGSAVVLVVVPILGAATLEATTIWFAPDAVPHTLRRLTLGAGPRPGIWLSAIGGVVILLGCSGTASIVVDGLRQLGSALRDRSEAAYASLILVVVAPVLVASRYAPIVRIHSRVGDAQVPVMAVPWFGVGSLLALVLTAVVAAIAVRRRTTGAGVALALAGWVITIPCAVAWAVGDANPSLSAPSWVRRSLSSFGSAHQGPVATPASMVPSSLRITLTTGSAAEIGWIAGAAIVAAGVLICRSEGAVT